MNCNKKDLLLYAVTDRSWLNGRTLYDQVEEALKGGATFIQLREKNLDTDSFLKEAAEIKVEVMAENIRKIPPNIRHILPFIACRVTFICSN